MVKRFLFLCLIMLISKLQMLNCQNEPIQNCKEIQRKEGCNICIIKEDKNFTCTSCYSGYYFFENQCFPCPKTCSSCIKDNNEIKCTSCPPQYAISLNGTCDFCGDYCKECVNKNNKITCLSCLKDNYALKDGECISCTDKDNIGEFGCSKCVYNNLTKEYQCYECDNNIGYSKYTFIKNTFKCIDNTNSSDYYLYGCLEANNIKDNKYECLKCKSGFTHVKNDKTCRNTIEIDLNENCIELINIGNEINPIYSCNKCNNETAKIINIHNISNCYERENELTYCLEGIQDKDLKNNCTICVDNAHLNNICECNEDSFGKGNLSCYKCDDINDGIPGCFASKGCEYNNTNDQLNCFQCKNDFFEKIKGKCFSCSNEIDYCNKCKNDSNGFECESCIQYFNFNKDEKYCELICEEYPEISPGCTICDKNNLKEKECQICQPGYFKTKEKSCIYCSTEKNGGPACNKCEYEKDENGNETENIICSSCEQEFQILNSKGKCYNCKIDLSNECKKCEFLNNGENEKLVCTLCEQGYYIDSNGNCKKCKTDLFNECNSCEFINDGKDGKLICTLCEQGYYLDSNGKCINCNTDLYNKCEKCNFINEDSKNGKVVCTSCINGYNIHSNGKCFNCRTDLSNECKECEYIKDGENEKLFCTLCESGYYIDSNGICTNCKTVLSDKCNECYFFNDGKNNKFFCTLCQPGYYIDSNGNCSNCKTDLFNECNRCEFINDGKNEKLFCTLCEPGYYLDSNGNCTNILKYLEKIEFCRGLSYNIGNITFYYNLFNQSLNFESLYYNNNYYYEASILNKDIIDIININLKTINSTIKGICNYCQNEYILNADGNCIHFSIKENCTINSIIQDNDIYKRCKDLCWKNMLIILVLNKSIDGNDKITISEIVNKYNENFTDFGINSILNKATLCVDNRISEFENCILGLYREMEDKYECYACFDGYTLDKKTNNCTKIEEISNCQYENIGDKDNPIYSCIKCHNYYYYNSLYNNYFNNYTYNIEYYSDYLLVNEDNINYCINKNKIGLENCLEVKANTTYIRTKYDCYNCTNNSLLYKSEYFGRQFCQNLSKDTEKNITNELLKFENIDYALTIDGKCERNNFFTPDNNSCYACNNKDVGMPGCKGVCSFSFKRNETIKCEDDCKIGYIEISEGLCELCDNINKGCYECHYETEYPLDYLGIKRKRRFVCDYCEDDYINKNGKCYHCSYYRNNCVKCNEENDEIKCQKCRPDYYLTEDNLCQYCGRRDEILSLDNKCIQCSGIIEGCSNCEMKENKTYCRLCQEGFILLLNNKTCLKISENKELEKFSQCDEISLDINNEIHCSKCKNQYLTLLKENNKEKCSYLPTINGFFNLFYYKSFYDSITNKFDSKYLYDYYFYDNIYKYFDSCLEAINLGSEDNPLYSCKKCYNLFEYDKIYKNSYTLVTKEKTNISYCISSDQNSSLINCTEAKMIINGRKIKYSCSKCKKDNILIYNSEEDINYCQSLNTTSKCMVKYCKECKSGDNYRCNSCLKSDYLVNKISGACVKKMEFIPAITWKEIYGLELYGIKSINGKNIHGPKIFLRGTTNSRINPLHAFLIYLIFKIRQSSLRNLEEFSKIEAICEVVEDVEDNNYTNLVDYECIGENKNNEKLGELINIEEDNNIGLLKKTNLFELVNETNLTDLIDKKPSFKLEDLMKIITFNIDKLKNQSSDNYTFDFNISGSIDKNLTNYTIIDQLYMAEYQDLKSDCIFNIEEEQKANLNCKLNIEKYNETKEFTFRTLEISDENYTVSLSNIYKIILKNIVENNNETDNEPVINRIYNKKRKKINAAKIVLPIIAGIISVIIGIAITYYFLVRKNTKNTLEIAPNLTENRNNSIKNSQSSQNIVDENN